MANDDLIGILQSSRHLRSREEVLAFDAALGKMPPEELDIEHLQRLFLVLDDDCDHPEVMYGLVHFLECFHEEDFLEAFVYVIPELDTYAADWVKTLHYRILNSDEARSCFPTVLRRAPPKNQEVVRGILQEISVREPAPLSSYATEVLSFIDGDDLSHG